MIVMPLKLGKLFLRFGNICSRYGSHREKHLAVDEMHKPYIRAKRNISNLPDTYTRTRWIPIIKNWKHRAKVNHQWEKHKISNEEADKFDKYGSEKNKLLSLLNALPPDEWLYIKHYVCYEYSAALDMVINDEVEGYFETWQNKFNDFGVKKIYAGTELIAIRKKV